MSAQYWVERRLTDIPVLELGVLQAAEGPCWMIMMMDEWHRAVVEQVQVLRSDR